MAQIQSLKGLEILEKVREILLENEHLKCANEELVARNVDLSSTIAELNVKISVLRAEKSDPQDSLLPLVETPVPKWYAQPPSPAPQKPKRQQFEPESQPRVLLPTPGLQNTQTGTNNLEATSSKGKPVITKECALPKIFFDGPESYCPAILKLAKQNMVQRRPGLSTLIRTVPHVEFIWGLNNTGAWYKPTQLSGKCGEILYTKNQKFDENAEVISQVGGQLCYMGTYQTKKRSFVSLHEFLLLSEIRQENLIAQMAGVPKKRTEMLAAYASKDLPLVRIETQRIAVDEVVLKCLTDAGDVIRSKITK